MFDGIVLRKHSSTKTSQTIFWCLTTKNKKKNAHFWFFVQFISNDFKGNTRFLFVLSSKGTISCFFLLKLPQIGFQLGCNPIFKQLY